MPTPPNLPASKWSLADTEQSIPARFEQQVLRYSDKIAICGTRWQPTFHELNSTANRHACALLARGKEPGGRVAILLPHDAPQIGSLLGILKAAKIPVALNPSDPTAYLEKLRLDADPEIVVTDSKHLDLALQAGFSREAVLTFDEKTTFSEPNLSLPILPRDVAGLIQTSGSTGAARSVIQTHRNVLHNVLRISNAINVQAHDRIALLASISGGLGIATTWVSLLNGATLCPFSVQAAGFNGLSPWLMEQSITIYTSATSVFRHFVKTLATADRFTAIRIVRLGSEPVLSHDFTAFQRHFPSNSFFMNAFACSEAGNVTQQLLGHGESLQKQSLSAGKPSEGIHLSLLDEEGQQVAIGETGEICVQSEFLSPGYWRNEELTAQRFADGDAPDQPRSFLTGDLGRFDQEGVLTVTGRKATRVKIHGFWVEPSEVEAILLSQPGVDGAVISIEATPQGDAVMTSFLTLRPNESSNAEILRRELQATLPSYMVPAHFIFVEEFPTTPHGKIDRRRLAMIKPARVEPSRHEPRDSLERTLHGLFSGVLPQSSFGIEDSFFDLGGDSLGAATLFAQILKVLHIDLPLVELKSHPSIAQLAARIRSAGWNLTDHPMAILTPNPRANAIKLFMWPGAGSDVMALSDLAQHMGSAVSLHAIQHRGADGRRVYDLSLAEMAARGVSLIRRIQPSGPYALCGTSFGGVVALEVARLLTADGERVDFLALLDTFGPGYPTLKTGIGLRGWIAAGVRWLRPIGHKDEPGFQILRRGLREKRLRFLARRSVCHPRPDDPPLPMNRRYLPLQEACFIALRGYVPLQFAGDVHLYRVQTQPPANLFVQDEMLGWKGIFTGHLKIDTIPGKHGQHLREPHVQVLAAKLNNALEQTMGVPVSGI